MSQEYKISLSQVCKDNGIVLATYKDAQKMIDLFGLNDMTRNAGFAFDTGYKKYILFDDGRSELEKRFTVAHELGHHLLGHFGYRREEDERYDKCNSADLAIALNSNTTLFWQKSFALVFLFYHEQSQYHFPPVAYLKIDFE
ncbi:MAG: ImmA/IrrE family metallo-endopeptidase [Agathobacter sp.]